MVDILCVATPFSPRHLLACTQLVADGGRRGNEQTFSIAQANMATLNPRRDPARLPGHGALCTVHWVPIIKENT
jgi:hypothetical protein